MVTRLLTVLGLVLLLLIGGGITAPEAPPSAQTALEGAARYYHTRPASETVLVRVTSADGRRTEQIRYRSRPDRRQRDWRDSRVDVEVDLGDVLAWTDGSTVRAVHRLDATSVFERTTDAPRPVRALVEVVPPLPLPQLDIIDGEARGFPRLTSYADGIEWADQVEVVSPATIRVRGRTATSVVEVELHPKSFRLQYVMIDVERGQAVIEIVFRAPDDGSHAGSLGVPVEGRTRLDAIADLHARPGDISVGLPLPDLLMTPWGDVAPEAGVVLGPGALIVFPAWNDDVAAAMTGIRRAVKDKVLERAWPLVVYDLASGNFDDTMAAIGAEVAPFPLHFSLSARSTLRRFSAEGRAALIVVDDHNIVRGIHDIEGGTGADEWYQRIRAALADGDPGE